MDDDMQKLCGWVGKILKVDLTHEQIEILDTMAYAEKFLGGLGIGQKLYWDHAAWGADAFDEQQPLIFMTGPLAATPAPSAPRLSICGKSPCIYPETFVSASLGGFFAPELKKAGFDGIIVVGRADGAVHIHIEDGNVEIREASQLWGLGNLTTHELLKNRVRQKCAHSFHRPGRRKPHALWHYLYGCCGCGLHGVRLGHGREKPQGHHGEGHGLGRRCRP